MNKSVRTAACVILIAAIFGSLGVALDRTESSITLAVTGLGLLLAWYSILDLQEQRKERFWPHTVDRLVRATFVAVTLAFAVHIALPNAEKPQVATPPRPAEPQRLFGDEVYAMSREGKLDDAALGALVKDHFTNLTAVDTRIEMTIGTGQRITIGAGRKGPIEGRVLP
ncbi:MAG: hypothetical protein IPJ77_07345 [Planctomycetes bacterium]|nr:hypothetical protein [Planctomycetota bacterium]